MATTPWISAHDYGRFSVMRRIEEAHLQPCVASTPGQPPGDSADGGVVEVEAQNPRTSTAERSEAVRDRSRAQTAGDTGQTPRPPGPPQRKAARRAPHSVARMGEDKLVVRASAETPYDLDTASASMMEQGMDNGGSGSHGELWYAGGAQCRPGVRGGRASRGGAVAERSAGGSDGAAGGRSGCSGVDDFAAKLANFQRGG